jgi:predicted TIM-barrel fold metal-dependent hydrolase
MWNSDSYRGDLSLWKVLQSRYGAEVSRELIRYADKYGLMLELLLRMHEIKQVARNLKDAQQTLSELNHMVSAIGRNLGSSHRLMKELQDLNAALLIRLSEFTRNVH